MKEDFVCVFGNCVCLGVLPSSLNESKFGLRVLRLSLWRGLGRGVGGGWAWLVGFTMIKATMTPG